MKETKYFFTTSLIIHIIVFIVALYIIMPAPEESKSFLDGLPIDIVKARPDVRLREKVNPEPEQKAEPERKQAEEIKSPETLKPVAFSLPVSESVNIATRTISGESRQAVNMPKGNTLILTKPPLMYSTPKLSDDADNSVIPALGGENVSITGSGSTGLPSLSVGPLGAHTGTKGASSHYIELMLSSKSPGEQFGEMFPVLARGILERVIQKKIDIVFIIDTTASMRDNIDGVREYIHQFLKPIEDKKIDVALGLVEFTDEEVTKAKVVGLTTDSRKFRKWMEKVRTFGGRDIPESGYEAIITALEKIDFRESAQRFFILISDSPQHDLDFDGKSKYSLDRIIAILKEENVTVDVVGLNYLPVKQLARGTGGQWKQIPGVDPLVDMPRYEPSMIRSNFIPSSQPYLVEDNVTIEFNGAVPDWVDLSYKLLDPTGVKVIGTLTYRKEVTDKTEKMVEFSLKMDLSEFKDQPGIYTLIYKMRDSRGNQDILRQMLELQRVNS